MKVILHAVKLSDWSWTAAKLLDEVSETSMPTVTTNSAV